MIYLDNSATTPVLPEVREYLARALESFGNPSSLYDLGIASEKVLKQSRETVAKTLHAKAAEIVFTSCGSESNNLALRGAAMTYQKRGRHLITSAVEHPSVRLTLEQLAREGFELTVLPVGRRGHIDLDELAAALRPDTILVSLMMVNNELGSVNPIAEAARLIHAKSPDALFHVDGVQAYGRLPLDVHKAGVDLYSLSGHKIGAPKGVGALYRREGVRLQPLIFGGGQESGLRGGTENFYYIGALALAAKLVHADRHSKDAQVANCKQTLLRELAAHGVAFVENGADTVPYIANLTFPGVKGEVLLHYLEGQGIYVSQGSACHAKSDHPSETLTALGLDREAQLATIRFSFRDGNEEGEMVTAAAAVKAGIDFIRGKR